MKKIISLALLTIFPLTSNASLDIRTACGTVQYVYTHESNDTLQILLNGVNGETSFPDGLAYVFFIRGDVRSRDYVISAINSSLFLEKQICLETDAQTVRSVKVFKN